MKITYSRKNTARPIKIYEDGKHVGYIIGTLTSPKKFAVEFNGIYFSGGNEGRIRANGGGSMGKWFNTLQKAYCYVDGVLSIVEVRPYPEPEVKQP